jgi:hypothetical protein
MNTEVTPPRHAYTANNQALSCEYLQALKLPKEAWFQAEAYSLTKHHLQRAREALILARHYAQGCPEAVMLAESAGRVTADSLKNLVSGRNRAYHGYGVL